MKKRPAPPRYTGCAICNHNATDPKHPEAHRVCDVCRSEIHTRQSFHADAYGSRHIKCEFER